MFVEANGLRLFFDVLNPKLEIVETGLKEKPTLICLPGGPGGDSGRRTAARLAANDPPCSDTATPTRHPGK